MVNSTRKWAHVRGLGEIRLHSRTSKEHTDQGFIKGKRVHIKVWAARGQLSEGRHQIFMCLFDKLLWDDLLADPQPKTGLDNGVVASTPSTLINANQLVLLYRLSLSPGARERVDFNISSQLG